MSDPVTPFPDTAAVLTDLHASGVPIGVVSDIGWDLRPVFERHGLYPLVGSWVLSFEHGIEKPDPRLFHRCCAELEVEPNEAIMIGDSVERDGGAANAGLTALVLPRYPGHGERGLRAAIHLLS